MNQIRDDLDSAIVDIEEVAGRIDALTTKTLDMYSELTEMACKLEQSARELRAMLRNAPGHDEERPTIAADLSPPPGDLSQLEREWQSLLPEGVRIGVDDLNEMYGD